MNVTGQSKELVVKEKPAPEDEPEEADSKQAEEVADKEEGKDSKKLEAQEKPSQPELMSLAVAPKVCIMYSM